VLVDNVMKKRWKVAKNQKEKTEALMASIKYILGNLIYAIDKGMDELMWSAEEYARLSLSGCSLGPLEKATQFLEEQFRSMEEQGVSGDQLRRIRDGLEKMKGRLGVLKEAKEKNGWSRNLLEHGF